MRAKTSNSSSLRYPDRLNRNDAPPILGPRRSRFHRGSSKSVPVGHCQHNRTHILLLVTAPMLRAESDPATCCPERRFVGIPRIPWRLPAPRAHILGGRFHPGTPRVGTPRPRPLRPRTCLRFTRNAGTGRNGTEWDRNQKSHSFRARFPRISGSKCRFRPSEMGRIGK